MATNRISAPQITGSALLGAVDPIWNRVRAEAETLVASEPALASFIWETVLNHSRLEDAIVHRVAERLGTAMPSPFDGLAAIGVATMC